MSDYNEDRIGEKKIMKCGMIAEIIEYRKYNDIDVKFEDGYIKNHARYSHFKEGNIKNPTIKVKRNYGEFRIGEVNVNTQGLKMKIIEYRTQYDIDIQFEDGSIRNSVRYDHFKEGCIINKNIPSLCNIGYIGSESTKDENYKTLKSYSIWCNMIGRCYNEDLSSYYNYGNRGVTVCKEWECYSNFKKWYDEHSYEIEGEEMHLDKDILVKDSKIYSPDTCILVPQRINNMFRRNYKNNDIPIGVTYVKKNNKYISRLNIDGKLKHLGTFDTPEEAFYIYKEAKEKEIKRVADEYKDKIPQKLYEAMYNYEVDIDD